LRYTVRMMIASGLFGLIIGSFLNVLVLRRGAKGFGGRSACMACGTRIAWYDNIPVVSWLALWGKCRACGSAISIQYPLVEVSTGVLFALMASALLARASLDPILGLLPLLALYFAIVALLVAITAYDIRHTIIPDAWAYTFALCALVASLISPLPAYSGWVFTLAAGPLAALPLAALWGVSRGRWMGLGDAKLALGIGWLLGPFYGIFAVFFAFVLGASISVPLLIFSSEAWRRVLERVTPTRVSRLRTRRFTMKSEIPFGPFLILSCLFIWFALLYNVTLPLAWMLWVP